MVQPRKWAEDIPFLMLVGVSCYCSFICLQQNRTEQNRTKTTLSFSESLLSQTKLTTPSEFIPTLSLTALLHCVIFTGLAGLAKPASLSSECFLKKTP